MTHPLIHAEESEKPVPEKADLEVLVRTIHANGKNTLRGICSNGDVTPEYTVRISGPKRTAQSIAQTKAKAEADCAKRSQEDYAFESLKKGFITITEGKGDTPHLTDMHWQCAEDKDGLPQLRHLLEVGTAGAPLPDAAALKATAKTMSDVCGFKRQQASLSR